MSYNICWAVTKSETGTWDLGTWGLDVVTRGRRDSGTWGLRDARTRRLGEVGREDVGTRRRAGIRGRDKQIRPDFCAELVKYNF